MPGLGWEMVRGLEDEEEDEDEEEALPQPSCGPWLHIPAWDEVQGVAGSTRPPRDWLAEFCSPARDCWHVHSQHLGLSTAGSCPGLCSEPAPVGPPCAGAGPPVPWWDPLCPAGPAQPCPVPQGRGSPRQSPRTLPSAAPTQPSSTPYPNQFILNNIYTPRGCCTASGPGHAAESGAWVWGGRSCPMGAEPDWGQRGQAAHGTAPAQRPQHRVPPACPAPPGAAEGWAPQLQPLAALAGQCLPHPLDLRLRGERL